MSGYSKDSISSLRNRLREKRRNLPKNTRANLDEAIQHCLSQALSSRQIRTLACYWPFDGEPDLLPLCRQLMTGAIEVALPVISDIDSGLMEFHRWREETELKKNQYGIPEPRGTESLPLEFFDMLLIPLVAYDKSGNRLGMGSGYYDRHLESIRNLQQPLRVGISYSLQEVDLMHRNDWDIPLHAIVNEHGWLTFN